MGQPEGKVRLKLGEMGSCIYNFCYISDNFISELCRGFSRVDWGPKARISLTLSLGLPYFLLCIFVPKENVTYSYIYH